MGFVMLALAAAAIELRRCDDGPDVATSSTPAVANADPRRDALIHCQELGEAGAHDPNCLRVWAENRRRFLGDGVRPLERPPIDMFTGAPPTAGGAADPTTDQPRAP
ncbi:putative entry exclusion protein TrbK-alt [Methylocapsa polymorpha]|uniref:Entry exclusion protein TrbK-alt n=1 Tax=Methylocapsa polymorpha TaxID=3080828 RepID=A0ABZ0HN59_9HYPH|nr:putative entry exclusion protein TrbK-alt [Methylocapsa sp. RX1]